MFDWIFTFKYGGIWHRIQILALVVRSDHPRISQFYYLGCILPGAIPIESLLKFARRTDIAVGFMEKAEFGKAEAPCSGCTIPEAQIWRSVVFSSVIKICCDSYSDK